MLLQKQKKTDFTRTYHNLDFSKLFLLKKNRIILIQTVIHFLITT